MFITKKNCSQTCWFIIMRFGFKTSRASIDNPYRLIHKWPCASICPAIYWNRKWEGKREREVLFYQTQDRLQLHLLKSQGSISDSNTGLTRFSINKVSVVVFYSSWSPPTLRRAQVEWNRAKFKSRKRKRSTDCLAFGNYSKVSDSGYVFNKRWFTDIRNHQ